MLSLAHDVRRQRAQHNEVDQPSQGDGGHGQQGVKAVLWVCKTREAQRLSTSAGSQGYRHGQRCLQGEVDGEDGSLQTGELWARQGAESHDTTDEGL